MFLKVLPPPPPFHEKAVQSYILWLNLKEISELSILQSADKVTPYFTFMRRAQNWANYGIEISAKKTKLMTHNTSGINTEIKINGQKLETVTSFRYLG